MTHPLVDQLRFARSEFVRSLAGVTEADGRRRFGPINSLSWMVGHLADQEQRYWLERRGHDPVVPGLNALVGSGQPASTPSLAEMWSAWRVITAAADPFLDTLDVAALQQLPPVVRPVSAESQGTMLLRMVDSTLGNGRQPSSAGTFEPTGSAPSQLANGPVAPPGPDGPNGPEGGPIVRGAMPTYGKLAQSVSGAAAFGQLMAKLGHDAGRTLARAPLAPADLGRLLVTVGVHPDEVNAVLVGEMLAQGVAVNEASIRTLRRGITASGGTLRDAAAGIALSRLGLPIHAAQPRHRPAAPGRPARSTGRLGRAADRAARPGARCRRW